MKACAACLRKALIRSEALGFAERRFTNTVQAAELLRLPTEQMSEQLRIDCPEFDVQIDMRIKSLAEAGPDPVALWAVCEHSDSYPFGLHGLEDKPHVLFGVGEQSRFCELTAGGGGVAIVGARRASSYGRDVAFGLGNELSAVGLTVISGLALGIDGAAHRGALQAGGRTIAVLAGGPDVPYPPSHRRLYEHIASAGSVVSENPPGTRAKRWAFPARNRIIAGLAEMTVLVEGTENSGARHTVEFAEQLHTEIGAVPGPVTSPLSERPNAMLIEDGIRVVRDAADVIEALRPGQGAGRLPGFAAHDFEGLKGDVIDCVRSGDNTPRAIALRLPMRDAREITRQLSELELLGLLRRAADGSYVLARKSHGGAR